MVLVVKEDREMARPLVTELHARAARLKRRRRVTNCSFGRLFCCSNSFLLGGLGLRTLRAAQQVVLTPDSMPEHLSSSEAHV